MLNRILVNTAKQVKRSGWIAWSSVAVMTLAFFVGSVFAGMAYLAHLYIRSIETKDNILVFFEVGTDQALVERLRGKWAAISEIKDIGFTSEEQAYQLYYEETKVTDPINNQILTTLFQDKKLNSSLDIQLGSLEYLSTVRPILLSDIEEELAKLEYDPKEPPIYIGIDDETLDEAREIFLAARVSGIVLLALLFIIIFFFVLMTVEYRTYNRMEEIGVMQLVGGSLGYIRAPYILEGAFYGLVGALISGLALGGIYLFVFQLNAGSTISRFLSSEFRGLPLPQITPVMTLLILAAKAFAGAVLGAVISYLAIRRYIK